MGKILQDMAPSSRDGRFLNQTSQEAASKTVSLLFAPRWEQSAVEYAAGKSCFGGREQAASHPRASSSPGEGQSLVWKIPSASIWENKMMLQESLFPRSEAKD